MISGLVIGIIFGALLQASQFCFFSGFRNVVYQKNIRFVTALMIAISVQSIGFFALQSKGLLTFPEGNLPILATILGGLLFGIGMALSGCCASSSWFRSGEGSVGIWIALFSFAITLASAQKGSLKVWVQPLLSNPSQLDTIYKTLEISPWAMVVLLGAITVFLLIYQKITSSSLSAKKGKFKPLSLNLAGFLIGLLGIIAWYDSANNGRNFGFGIAGPTGSLVQFLVTGQHRYLNWGTLFVVGIVVGSILSAKLRGEFELRLPLNGKIVAKRLFGGIFLGIGATLAGGCTIANSLVATAYFSWQGWIATFSIMIGLWTATYYFTLANKK